MIFSEDGRDIGSDNLAMKLFLVPCLCFFSSTVAGRPPNSAILGSYVQHHKAGAATMVFVLCISTVWCTAKPDFQNMYISN